MSITDIVKYNTDGGNEISLSGDTVRKYLVRGNGGVSDQEVVMFIELCKAHKLNPFLNEAYLIKFGSSPASIVTGKEAFTKRAERHPEFDGFEAGVTILTPDRSKVVRRDGTLVLEGEHLVGGWARVHRKDRSTAAYDEVKLEEYIAKKSDGTPNSQWTRMPGTMIRKVALVHALREAFPETFSGLYAPEEMGTDPDSLDAPQRQREPIQAEIIEDPSTDAPEKNQRDYSRLSDLKARWSETFAMSIEDAGRAIVGVYGNPTHMADDEYEAMCEGVQAELEPYETDKPVADLSEMDEVPF